ncbi:MAG: DUF933 domain-containing protein [Acidimicrobiia bacterium]
MLRIAIVGSPNAGKTTLFNALTGLEAATAPHPFTTIEPNIGVAKVPDELLERAAAIEGSKKVVHAALELLDMPSIGPSVRGGGPAAKMLGKLRELDALAVVLRAFQDEAVPTAESGTDPAAQAEEMLIELTLADAELFSRRLERLAKEASAELGKKREEEAIRKATTVLDEARPLRAAGWTDEERAFFRDLAPLTLKPAVWIINVGEDDETGPSRAEDVSAVVPSGDLVLILSASLEEEGSRLDPDERAELFEGLGLGEGALTRVVAASYQALDLVCFYTINPNEAHAWSVERGRTAREAAGKVHSDLERGFIRAEFIDIATLVELGGWDAAKSGGQIRVEGRDYVVQDGEVMLVRFSV